MGKLTTKWLLGLGVLNGNLSGQREAKVGKNVRPQMTRGNMRIACSIPKATNIFSEYVILTAFPLQQWLHERASVLRYTYIACIVEF